MVKKIDTHESTSEHRHVITNIDDYIRQDSVSEGDTEYLYDIQGITSERVVIVLQEGQSLTGDFIDYAKEKTKLKSIMIISPQGVTGNSVKLGLQNIGDRAGGGRKSRDITVRTYGIDGDVEIYNAKNVHTRDTGGNVEMRNIGSSARSDNTGGDSLSLDIGYLNGERITPKNVGRGNSIHLNTQGNSVHQQINGNAGTFGAKQVFTQSVHDLVLQDITALDGNDSLGNQHIWGDAIQLESKSHGDQPNTQKYLQVVSLDEHGVTIERVRNALQGFSYDILGDPREEITKLSTTNGGRYIIDWSRLEPGVLQINNDIQFLIDVLCHELEDHKAPELKGTLRFKGVDIKYRIIREKQGDKQMKRVIFY